MRLTLAVFLLVTASAVGQDFTLASSGCAKAHCTGLEDDAIGILWPTPSNVKLGTLLEWPQGGAEYSEGCTSNGQIMACILCNRLIIRML